MRRVSLHDLYGGRRQGGIGPSATTPNILVFTEPRTGARYGYHDHWEGVVLHYTGEGQVGDQTMTSGNRAILNHRAVGRRLRLFKGVRGIVRYEDEYELDGEDGWYQVTASDVTGAARKVIVFRLRPVNSPANDQSAGTYPLPDARFVYSRESQASFGLPAADVDQNKTTAVGEPFAVDPNLVDRGTQGHNRTQNALKEFLESRGVRTLMPNPALGDPDFDLGWIRGHVWYVAEVKSLTVENETRQMRLALGQVLDYHDRLLRRHDDVRAVIAVERPVADRRWVSLCERHRVALVWPDTFDVVLSPVLSA